MVLHVEYYINLKYLIYIEIETIVFVYMYKLFNYIFIIV